MTRDPAVKLSEQEAARIAETILDVKEYAFAVPVDSARKLARAYKQKLQAYDELRAEVERSLPAIYEAAGHLDEDGHAVAYSCLHRAHEGLYRALNQQKEPGK